MRRLLAPFTLLLLAAPAAAAPPGAPGARRATLEDAADHHVGLQGDYAGGLHQSWEWLLGSGRSAPNITGAVAHGLLAAHRITGLAEHEASALRAARSLLAAGEATWKDGRPRTQDVEFLAAAGFIIDAARWFSRIAERDEAAAFADRLLEQRAAAGMASMAGWDIASAARAAIAVGRVGYGRALLRRSLERRAAWDRDDRGAARLLSYGSLLWSLGELRRHAGLGAELARFAEGLTAGLISAQDARGGWLAGGVYATQTVAFAVLGLERFQAGAAAAARGRAWLDAVARQDRRFLLGGRIWASSYDRDGRPGRGYHALVQSEVLRALAGAM